MRIGIDLMGSDQPPEILLEAVKSISLEFPEASFFVFTSVKTEKLSNQITSILVPEFIEMHESPLFAVRKKKNSSMAVGMKALAKKEIDAFVSAGNTGALVATARLHLAFLETISTPALLVLLPSEKGHVAVLDVGAGISFKPTHLIDYAKMGSLYQKIVFGIENPKIGLLNTGVEEIKGTELVKMGYQLLSDTFPHFIGNIEGRDVFTDKIDVLVTDGFTGNIFLKTCEGVSAFLFDYMKKKSGHLKEALHSFQSQFNYAKHPGGLLVGLDGVVVKCHGASNATAFASGIKGAMHLVQRNLIVKLKSGLDNRTLSE